MAKITRNMSTPENRAFWKSVEQSASEVATWPAWQRCGAVPPGTPCGCCGSTAGVEFLSGGKCRSCGLRHAGPRPATPRSTP